MQKCAMNLNYQFNVNYFKIFLSENADRIKIIDGIKIINDELLRASAADFPQKEWNQEELPGYASFSLKTAYPGLLMGLGVTHEISAPNDNEVKLDDLFKLGFSFDFVTGVPYLPGSSLKGVLRSYFPKNAEDEKEIVIKKALKMSEDFDVLALKRALFDSPQNATFLGVYPSTNAKGKPLLQEDYITPHGKNEFAEPQPLKFIKVGAGVPFDFCFILQDYHYEQAGAVQILEAKRILHLFKELVIHYGVGAKTNVGYGRFRKIEIQYAK